MTEDQDIKILLDNNRQWASKRRAEDPEFFLRLSRQQKPKYLWIGCSDSRVPANQIIGLDPGEVFVHRNVANQVIHTDFNAISVMQYAIEYLDIRHIIVCGHYECGGIFAALQPQQFGIVDNWLRGIKDLHFEHQEEIASIKDERIRANRLSELNVERQVKNIGHSPLVQNAWKRGHKLSVHGWIYSIEDGLVRDLNLTISNRDQISPTHRLD